MITTKKRRSQQYNIQETPRLKQFDDKDVTTVLLVDSRGRSSFGRYQNVKPDIGLITSTARTFIQDGITTEYATQVLGTTLDNGRLYAHLLSKSSRVLYDDGSQSKSYESNNNNKKWNVKESSLNTKPFINSIDFVLPNVLVDEKKEESGNVQQVTPKSQEEEILKEESSNNFRVPYDNVKVFKITPEVADLTQENVIIHKESKEKFIPSKVRPWDELPTFTVRNEFSPSGLSFLGDIPEFEQRTERSKLTTPAERKAKFLLKAGLTKPNARELTSITYTGFADFTTTVGDTVIIFSPHTTQPVNMVKESKRLPKIESTINPTTTLLEPPLMTKVLTYLSQEPPMETKTFKGPDLDMKTTIATMVIDKTDRIRDPKSQLADEKVNMDAKSAVLAHEQGQETVTFSPDVIQASETQIPMLSTPSDEDIAKIFASLKALEQKSTVEETTSSTGGKTTIFFDDEPIQTTSTKHSQVEETITATTESEELLTTANEITTTENEEEIVTEDAECTGSVQIVPTTTYKTLTYLTTFFIPNESSTSTSVRSNLVVSSELGLQTKSCQMGTTTESIITTEQNVETTTETETEKPTTEQEILTTTKQIETTTSEITTEEYHVTESEAETTEATTEDGDELEIIYKTLYTTYTYLTTYFQESSTSIASRTIVTTNVVSSTLDPNAQSSVDSVEGIMDMEESTSKYKTKTVTFDDFANITPTSVNPIKATSTDSSTDWLDSESGTQDSSKATPGLDDSKILAEGVKTYYTTYTYFTTIFVDGETEISSRTEVYTNYVTPSGVQQEILNTQSPDDSDDYVAKKIKLLSKIKPGTTYNTINRHKQEEAVTTTESNEINDTLDLSEYETISTMVTDVRSSTSEGDRRIIDNVGKRNVLLDDQVFSESNNESEITPHPTLLLQTSYTTFTYFTTMYQGTTSSNVVSRLETVTNVVTQTLEPKEMKEVSSTEDPNAPVTYFTTFTYWTTLYKEGTTKITSREETVTNVETASIKATSTVPFIEKTAVHNLETSMEEDSESSKPQTVGDDELTTYFTTYTYYTTSYIGNSTVLNSRLETVTNVINNTADIDTNYIGRAIGSNDKNKVDITSTIKPTGLISTILNTIENNGTTTLLSTDVYGTYIDGLYAKVLESTSSILTTQINASKIQASETLKPTGVVSINKGKIVDAEGVSTLFYQTQAIGTYIDNLYAQVIESTSSLAIDEAKKSALPADLPVVHRTGLVRHIEGSIVQNKTTTFYESNVLGTFIDGRYAQVIQSTSSFLTEAAASITPASTLSADKAIPNTQLVTTSPSPVAIEGSFNENKDEESDESDDDEDDNDDKSKSRLTFQSKKRTFTPAIRPFASRQRPSFAPKRKQLGQGTAATITRSDFTPTVTAVPASSKTNRFGGRRSSSSINPSSTSRRFSRTKSSTTSGFNRRGSSSRIQPSSTLNSSSRRSGFRTSSAAGALNRSSRLRIRPTLASGLLRSPSSKAVTETPPEDENNLTTLVTEEPNEEGGETTLDVQGTTEASTRRSQNPLLKFRRPPLTRPSATRTTKSGKSATTPATTTTSTTSRPRTTRANSLLNRSRSNALFPRRGLFTTTTTAAPEEEEIVEDNEDLVEEEEDDTDYDSSLRNTQTVNPPTTTSTTEKPVTKNRGVQIKPFFRRRSKRATYSRFRRPTTTTTQSTIEEETEEVTHKPKRSRYNKNRGSTTTTTTTTSSPRKRIIPSKVSSSSRTQFTLRDTGFKRPTSSKSSTSRSRSASTRNTNSRYSKRVPTSYQSETTRKTTTNNRQSSRTSSRGRQRQQSDPENDNQVKQKFDGTITVTRQIPTEVTIPVVNGKVTEYKNIVTAKYSTEVLNPNQYTTSVNALGKGVTILLSENTDIINGATLITQYVLKETPTSSVVFTPTYINRRKTSFSHVIPSTIYEVEPVVNTIQPLAAQAPLANILLSQLLLGGIQQQPNPALLGLQQIHQQPGLVPITPTTELKTRTTTYVTTVTSETSTIVPLTFRGKEILTTIIDTNVMVVTATEFLTDTVTVTPTLGYQPQQLNTALLLPLLQQQLQQQQAQQIPAGLLNLNSNEHVNYQEPEKFNLAEVEEEEVIEEQVVNSRQRKPKKNKPVETSVITLYVSGRTPGEFTTVLSTVVAENANRNRRNVKTESISTPQLILNTEESAFDNSIALESSEVVKETESLESIIGDVSKHFAATKQTRSSDDFLA
ncbi:unnamed protein product [Phyllotreta striolata]|uniref:DUF4758 domain-containing protein n=1 Tax=Phyllotreta striolata TaxID=444603 RepID=A0A9N9TLP3_PHYSR|nr:unnamed protein product [Phyllotreta striolata]